MANLVAYEIRVKGTKAACETVLNTQHSAECYTVGLEKRGKSNYIKLSGECKGGIDSQTQDDLTIDGFKSNKIISEEDLAIIDKMSLLAKSRLFKCEIEAIEYFDDDDSLSHYRYKSGEVLLSERAFIDSLNGFEFDKEEINLSPMLSLGEADEKLIHIRPEEKKLTEESDMSNFIIEGEVLKGYRGKAEIVRIPENVKVIYDRAFYHKNEVVEIDIPDSVRWIGSYAFESCLSLNKLGLDNPDVEFDEDPFCDCDNLWQGNYKTAGCFLLQYRGNDEMASVPEGIQVIGWGAFAGSNVQRVALPESVIKIERFAFDDCKDLEKIVIPNENCIIADGAFSGCDKLSGDSDFVVQGDALFEYKGMDKKVVVPDGIKTISSGAFSDNEMIEIIKLPETLTEISDRAFSGCSNLKEIDLPKSVCSIGTSAFSETGISEISIPNATKTINRKCFYRCGELRKVMLSESTTQISSGAFEDCEQLEEISFPASLEEIGYNAFSGCSSLKTVIIPASVKEVGSRAFAYCKELSELSILSDDTNIAPGAFVKCDKLKDEHGMVIINHILDGYYGNEFEVVVPEGVDIIASGAFANSTIGSICFPGTLKEIGYGAFSKSEVEEVSFKEGITCIGQYAFEECKNLKEIEFPSSIETIESNAFRDSGLEKISLNGGPKILQDMAFSRNEALKEVNLSEGFEEIGVMAFYECKKLSQIEIPGTVKSIGKDAFAYCGLKKVIMGAGVESVGSGAFSYNKGLKEFIMPDSVTAIGTDVLRECKNLKNVRVSGGLNVIPKSTIAGDPWGDTYKKLKSIVIASGVTEIDKDAITDCKSLEEIHIPETVVKIKKNAFEGCPKLTIYGKAKSAAEKYAKKEKIPFVEE